jgi:toxin-antitoxin system PIN domain toxin
MSRRALLDINVLVALFDPDHVHHDLVHHWFADHRGSGWASCPITQNGLVRVLSNPRYGSPGASVRSVRAAVRRLVSSKDHEFWSDDIALTDDGLFEVSSMVGHRHITDVYLLALARKRKGHLVTLDRSIPVRAVTGAGPESLTVIAPIEG